MPELPEVERACKFVRDKCILRAAGKALAISAVTLQEQGGGPRNSLIDEKVISLPGFQCKHEGVKVEQPSYQQYEQLLVGKQLVAVERKGKYMWLVLDEPASSSDVEQQHDVDASHQIKNESSIPDALEEASLGRRVYLMLHFGMTGSLSVKGEGRLQFMDFKVDNSWPPMFCKLEIVFKEVAKDTGSFLDTSETMHLAYTDSRRFGRILLLDSPPALHPKIASLARDPILDPPSFEEFRKPLSASGAVVKSVLLDQTKVVSGIGNYLADEVLYQARIHPKAICRELEEEQVKELYDQILAVCRLAVKVNADDKQYPENWIFHHRWGKLQRSKRKADDGDEKGPSKARFTYLKVGGRTTCIDKTLQSLGRRKKGKTRLKTSTS